MRKLALVLCSIMILGSSVVYADSNRFVTLGEDLSQEQEEKVLQFFNLSEDDLSTIQVVSVSNDEEREYLSGIVDDEVIGTHTYSCAYIQPTTEGGIQVKTANLTYVTSDVLVNALQTAGIENCNVIVTAPFEVSGTGALTGIYKGYELQGVALDEDKKKLASEELIITAELGQECGEETSDLITDIKQEVISAEKDLSEDEIKDIVENKAVEYNININSQTIDKIVDLLSKIQEKDYSIASFTTKVNEEFSGVVGKVESAGVLEKIKGFFQSIVDFIKNFFSGDDYNAELDTDQDTEQSIFDDVNTDVFDYDDAVTEEDSTAEVNEITTEDGVTQGIKAEEGEWYGNSTTEDGVTQGIKAEEGEWYGDGTTEDNTSVEKGE